MLIGEGIMISLIDGDSIAYKYASIYQDTVIWDDSDEDNIVASVSTDLETALEEMDYFIEGIRDHTDTDDSVIILSPKKSFRYDVTPTYKGNRKPPKVPLEMLLPIREHLLEKGALLFDNVEADDVCVSRMYKEPGKYVLCHIDKDLNQAPGKHYDYNTQESYEVTQEEADYWFYLQVLEGDSVDGVKGCPKIGKIKAAKILAATDPKDYWEVIEETYDKAGMTYEYLIEQAQLVYMLRDFDEETQQVNLWTPTGVKNETKV